MRDNLNFNIFIENINIYQLSYKTFVNSKFFFTETNQRVEFEELLLAMTILSWMLNVQPKFFYYKKKIKTCKILYLKENEMTGLNFFPPRERNLAKIYATRSCTF